MQSPVNCVSKWLRNLSLLIALLVGAGGCGGEQAHIAMPENPKPLPDPETRLTTGEEASETSIEIKLSK